MQEEDDAKSLSVLIESVNGVFRYFHFLPRSLYKNRVLIYLLFSQWSSSSHQVCLSLWENWTNTWDSNSNILLSFQTPDLHTFCHSMTILKIIHTKAVNKVLFSPCYVIRFLLTLTYRKLVLPIRAIGLFLICFLL